VWPLALLVLFLGTFRRTPPDASAAQAGDVDPTDVAVLTDLGDTYLKDGRVDLAEQAYRRALAVDRVMATCTFGSANCCSSAAIASARRPKRNRRCAGIRRARARSKLAERSAPPAGAIHDQ
jgi:hypothetical protein